MTAKYRVAEAALKRLQSLTAGGKRPGANYLTLEVDIITSKGTDEQVLRGFESIPAEKRCAFPRMLLLRRLFLLGERFIANEHYMDRFAHLQLLQEEMHKMVREFGERKVIDFRRTGLVHQLMRVGRTLEEVGNRVEKVAA